MPQILLAFLAGVVTIGGPCILPLLPILLGTSVAGRNPLRPVAIIGGFVLAWVSAALLFASFGTLLGASQTTWRLVASVVIIFFGVLMAAPMLQARLLAPLEPLLSKLQPKGAVIKTDLLSGFLLGLSLGAVWTPCAGPVLGSVLTLIAGQGSVWQSGPAVLAYALGAGLPMLVIAYGGQWAVQRVHALAKYAEPIQRLFGFLIIVVGFMLMTGADLRLQLWVSSLQERLRPRSTAVGSAADLPVIMNGRPAFTGISQWWNTPGNQPLTDADLKGKVVLVDFWTYSCINCIRTQPVLKAWWSAYEKDGLVIVGVHTPEFAFEKDPANVTAAIARAGLLYPIALDAGYGTWNAYSNQYWPAEYLFDRQGRLRHTHFGEGEYDVTEGDIRALLAEGGPAVTAPVTGVDTTPNAVMTETAETYFGLARQSNFVDASLVGRISTDLYSLKGVGSGEWSLGGHWSFGQESITNTSAAAVLRMRVQSNAMHVVMGASTATPVAVTIDGASPTDAELSKDMTRQPDGSVTVTVSDQRLYTVGLWAGGGEHLVELAPKAPGVMFYATTFGE